MIRLFRSTFFDRMKAVFKDIFGVHLMSAGCGAGRVVKIGVGMRGGLGRVKILIHAGPAGKKKP